MGLINMTGIDVGIVIAYFVIIITVGFISSKRAKTSDTYLVAGQRLGYWMTFACLSAVMLGGASTIGTTTLGYNYGISGMWMVVMLGLGLALVGVLLYRRIRKFRVLTVAELLTKRFGNKAGILSALVSAVYTMMVCATQVIAMGTILQSLLHWDPTTSMIVVGAIVILYTILGGMWAVTLTDFIQFFLIVIGVLGIMLPFCLGAAGGMEGVVSNVPAEYWDITNIGWPTIIQFFFLYALGALVGQDIWQRYLTARSVKVARRSGIASGLFILIYAIGCALIGMAAFVVMPNFDTPSFVFATMANNVIPTGFLGIVLAAVLAVLMSTASGTLLASASLITNDIVKPISVYRRTKSGKAAMEAAKADLRSLHVSRRATLVIGILAMIVAVALQDVLVALDVSYAILSGGLFFPIIMALFWRRATPRAAIISIVGSSVCVCIGLGVMGLTAIEPIAIGLVVGLVLMVGVTLFETRGGREPHGVPENSMDAFVYDEDADEGEGFEKIFDEIIHSPDPE
jgi:SSS family solute:Na+ symporter